MSHKITPVEGSLGELLKKTFVNQLFTGFIRVDGVVLQDTYTQIVDKIENFEVRDDDVWVCSFPKSGTTWTQEMVWCIANDLDFERGKVPLTERFPRVEQQNTVLYEAGRHDYIDVIDNLPSPRFIKSHLPFYLLPRELRTGVKKAKIVYVARDAKDNCISFYNFIKYAFNFKGNFDQLCDLFIGNTDTLLNTIVLVPYGPFWDHVLSYQTRQVDGNILFLKFEDMKKDLTDVMKRTASFLGKRLTSDQLSNLSEHLSFASMKANPAVNYRQRIDQVHRIAGFEAKGEFMRDGNLDQWKTVMSPETIKRFDDWTSQCLKNSDLHF